DRSSGAHPASLNRERFRMQRLLFSFGLGVLGSVSVACTSPRERARADSVQAVVAQQELLMARLTSQRDSVSRMIGEADHFIGKIDSSISRVKGLPKASRPAR